MQVRVLSLAIVCSCCLNQSHALSNHCDCKSFRLGVSVVIQPLIVSITLIRSQSESGVGAHMSANGRARTREGQRVEQRRTTARELSQPAVRPDGGFSVGLLRTSRTPSSCVFPVVARLWCRTTLLIAGWFNRVAQGRHSTVRRLLYRYGVADVGLMCWCWLYRATMPKPPALSGV